MEWIGSVLLTLALALLVALFVARPFFQPQMKRNKGATALADQEQEHDRSALLAERDRILTALQELEFDFVLGKVPAEDYPEQRAILLQNGAGVLRRLDEIEPETRGTDSAEDRIEAAVAARRADAVSTVAGAEAAGLASGNGRKAVVEKDAVEDLIASRKRQREEKSAGFCPGCGKPVQKSDRFCSRCGATL